MKSFERIFLYSMLAILFFYVFLVDGNVESQEAIQEEIRAKRIIIVNDEGQEVVWLSADKDGYGGIVIDNKDGTSVAGMVADENGGSMEIRNKDGNLVASMVVSESRRGGVVIYNKSGTLVAIVGASEYGVFMGVANKDGNPIADIVANENDNGEIRVYNKSGKETGSLP